MDLSNITINKQSSIRIIGSRADFKALVSEIDKDIQVELIL